MKHLRSTSLAVSSVLALGTVPVSATATANPFGFEQLAQGYAVSQVTEAKCGAADKEKAKDKAKEHKCGEGKCGEGMHAEQGKAKAAELKTEAEAKLDTDAKAEADKKASEQKCGEGKCGEGKCGVA